MGAAGIGAAGAVAAAGVSSGVGALAGSKNSGGSSTNTQAAPWAPQQSYLENTFQAAQTDFGAEQSVPYPDQWVAQENGQQSNATNALYNFGMNTPNTYAPWAQAGQNLAATQPTYTNNAEGIASNGIGSLSPSTQMLQNYAATGDMVPGQTSLGTQGLQSGQNVSNMAAMEALNPNGAINAAQTGAAAMSNNPTLNAAIQAANTQTNLGLTEDTLPQIRAQSMMDGNANSSREGALEGLATQSAQLADANTAATMEASAYNNGANLGENGYLSSLNSAIGAGSALTNNGSLATSAQLQAATNAGTQALGYQTANTGAELAANGQLGTGLPMGLQDQNSALAADQTGLTAAQAAGAYQQQQNQLGINNNLDAYNFLTTEPSNILNQYVNVVGQKDGQLTNSTTTPNNGGLTGALSGGIGGLLTGSGLSQNSNLANNLSTLYTNIFGNPSTQVQNYTNSDGTLNGAGLSAVQNLTPSSFNLGFGG